MQPWPAGKANSQSPTQAFPHRSWTDHHVPPHPTRDPHAPRSASFSASRSAIPNWNDLPPPPVPPRPAALFPGFSSPALAHSDRDLFFVQPPLPVNPPPQWHHAPSIPGPSQSSGYPFHDNTSINSSWASSYNSAAAPPVPTRPTYVNGYAHAAQSERDARPMSYAPVQHFYEAPTPPPVVPPRPMTAHGDMRLPASASAPEVPPKPPTLASSHSAPPPNLPQEWFPPTQAPHSEIIRPAEDRPPPISNPSEVSKPAENLLLLPNTYSEYPKRPSGHVRTQSADDVARAMEISLAESQAHGLGGRNFEEDHELQRVLADSLAMSRPHLRPEAENSTMGEGSSSRSPSSLVPTPTGEAISPISEAADREAEAEAKRLQRERDGKAAVRMLMEQEERRLAQEKLDLERRDEEIARQQIEEEERTQRRERDEQERKDADLARRLAKGDEAGPSHTRNSLAPASAPAPVINTNSKPSPLPSSKSAPPPETHTQPAPQPPQYDDVVATGPVVSHNQKTRSRPPNQSVQSTPAPSVPSPQSIRGRTASAIANSAPPPQERPQFSRASSVGAGAVVLASGQGHPTDAQGNRVSHQDSPTNRNAIAGPSSASRSAAATANGLGPPLNEPPPTNHSTRTSNTSSTSTSQGSSTGTDPELLRGVSFGFEPPKMPSTPVDLPACHPFPEVISLYPAPAPSFHIMAMSWRHLMRLLAQFETRIEPSVKAIAQSKDESILRVAIQFLKLPYTANEWRTVIHLSIDQPVPPNTPQAFRFTNGDTTVLPYSFAKGEIPPHLKISTTSLLYAVPLSHSTPFPILPLALPNLALYLQSAMRDSRARKVQHDTSNTMRRLARMVSTCYPDEVPTAKTEERESGRGMGGLFKRVVGRGGAKRQDTQGNEDVYDMVTPFRIDKYTTVS